MDDMNRRPNPHPLGQFSKPVSDYLENSIWFYIEDTGNLPTAKEYLEMCQAALENACLPSRTNVERRIIAFNLRGQS